MDIKNQIEQVFQTTFQAYDSIEELRQFKSNCAFCLDAKEERLIALCAIQTDLKSISIPEEWKYLKYLNLSSNKNLAEFRLPALPHLEHLDVSDGDLNYLELKAGFKQLECLDVSRNQLRAIALNGEYPELVYLDLAKNQLEEITLPTGLPKLAFLYLNANQLKAFYTTATFWELKTLHLAKNQLKNFDTNLLAQLPKLESLYLNANQQLVGSKGGAANASGGRSCLEAMHSFHRDLLKGEVVNNEHKVLVVGNGGVGKSCMVARLVGDKVEDEWNSTHGISLKQYKDKEEKYPYVLNLWDFGGQDIYHTTHRLFMQSNAIYLALWDWKTEYSPETPREESGALRSHRNHPMRYWQGYIKKLGEESPTLIIQTKVGLHGTRDLKDRSLIREQFGDQIREFLHLDSKQPRKSDFRQLRDHISYIIEEEDQKEKLPKGWYDIRQSLREIQASDDPETNKRMSIPAYQRLAHEFQIDDPMGCLKNWLVFTGVVFYKENLFNGEIILNQDWAIKAIYTLFDRDDTYYEILEGRKGKITGDFLMDKVWKGEGQNYDESECALLVSFMLGCEMCFETTKDEKRYVPFRERSFVAPQLLPKEKPAMAIDIEEMMGEKKPLIYEYRHDFLHYGVIQSFIVKTQFLAATRGIWRNGILIKSGKNMVLIEEVGEDRIRIKTEKCDFSILNEIRNLLEEIQGNKGVKTFVSLEGKVFVELNKIKGSNNDQIIAADGDTIVNRSDYLIFIEEDEQKVKHPKTNILQHPKKNSNWMEKFNPKNKNDMHPIKELIGRNEIDKAFDALQAIAGDRMDEVLLLQGRWNGLKSQRLMGLINNSESNLQANQIAHAILSVLQNILNDSGVSSSPILETEIFVERSTPLVAGEEEKKKTENNGKSKILYICASPKGTKSLSFTQEMKLIEDGVRNGDLREGFDFSVKAEVEKNKFSVVLNREKPSILHLSMHASKAKGLYFVDKVGVQNPIDVDTFAAYLEVYCEDNKLDTIILSACNTLAHAEAILPYAENIIATQDFFPDEASKIFTEAFYNNLLNHATVKNAFRFACIELRSFEETFEDQKYTIQEIPVLFINKKRIYFHTQKS